MVGVGVIGAGMIGQDHIRRITEAIGGGRIVAVSDIDAARGQAVADGVSGAVFHGAGEALILAQSVEAVLVTSSGPTHEAYVLAALAAGKPVFCEKPLTPTQDGCARIMAAEMAGGRRLIQVGFMRRYDGAYRALKQALDAGRIGAPLLVHCAHRNPSSPETYTADMSINDTAIHEIDTLRWLLGEEIAATRVLKPRRSSRAPAHLQDPLLLVMESVSGVLIDVEVSVNVAYGYDIRCEISGETGTAALGEESGAVLRAHDAHSGRIPASWRERFLRAYDVELQEWLAEIGVGKAPSGPSAWDGYAAAVVCDSALAALKTGERSPVVLPPRPAFYADAAR